MSDPSDMTVFSLLKARMGMLSDRQKVIAQNVANVSTPGYVPSDVNQESFARTLDKIASGRGGTGTGMTNPVHLTATHPGHVQAPHADRATIAVKQTPDSETTLDGNQVVVEEQMMKIAETRTDFETMTGLYQKSLGLLRLATRSPSR
jgi:flagellar basal-body rod protein FlgB